METVFNLILYFAISVVGFLVISYFTGRKKSNISCNSSERLAKTLQKKFSKYIDDLNRKIKTPEDIQDEMLEALDDYKSSKIKEIKRLIVHLTNTETSITNNISKLKNAKSNIEYTVRKMKGDPNSDVNVGGQMMMQIEQLDNSIKTSNESLKKIKEQALNINSSMAKFVNKIEMKRAEVLTLISSYIATSCNSSIKFDIDLSDLMCEYNTELKINERNNKIDEIANNKITNTPEIETSPEKYIEIYKSYNC